LARPAGAARCSRVPDAVRALAHIYEALAWRDRALIAIGDVQGHSLRAATVMGELRHALRAFASEGHAPLAMTGPINEVLRRYHPGIIATLCLVLADPGTGDLEIVNCGHMPPLPAHHRRPRRGPQDLPRRQPGEAARWTWPGPTSRPSATI
jgi:hypothetical protein